MNIFNKKNTISFRLSVLVGIATVVMVGSLIYYSVSELKDTQLTAARNNAMALARDFSGKIATSLDAPLNVSRTFARALQAARNEEQGGNISREDVIAMFRSYLENDPSMLGIWTIWEPNAFDGKDSLYVNTKGHDATGRLVPYWARSGKELVLEPNVGHDNADSYYYQTPKRTGRETVVDPYLYPVDGKEVLMVSMVVPVMSNGTFVGGAGTDVSIDWVQTMVDDEQKNIFSGLGQLYVFSNDGTLAAASGMPELVGTKNHSLFQDFQRMQKKDKLEIVKIQEDTLLAFASLRFGLSDKDWLVCVTVPMQEITKDAQAEMYKMIFLGIIFLVVFVILVSYLLKKLISPVLKISEVAEKVALGNLTIKQVPAASEEIKKLNESFLKVVNSQRDITNVCTAIANGDFSQQAKVKSENDHLALSVNQMISNLLHAHQEDSKRNWVTEGLARFGEILRSEGDLKSLAEVIIAQLVKYVKANQGAFFILNDTNESDKYLEQLACYAYNRKKYLEKRIEFGEGLVGQCYLEKESVFMTEVPQNFVKITSGLGQANPSSILVVPLLNNGQVEGIIELASFRSFEDHEIAFIEKVAESIASTISMAKINQITKKLLNQAQQQAEELRAQEEEMRQNLEELEATQEEIHRKERSYQKTIEKMERLLATHHIHYKVDVEIE